MSQEAILQELTGLLRGQGARLDFLERRMNVDTRSFNTGLNNSSSSLSRFRSSTDSVLGPIVDFGLAASTGRAKLQDFYSAFNNVPIAKFLSGPAAGLMEYGSQLLYSYRDLTRSGAGFSGSLTDMMQVVAKSRLDIEQFNAMVRINAETFASAPGGINRGIATFVDAQDKLMGKESKLRDSLLALGYTSDDTAVFLGDIMRRQGNMSVRGALDADQLSKATHAYAMEIDNVSKLTGKRKEQIAEEIRKSSEDALFKRAQMGMDETQKMLSNKFMAQATMLGPEMASLMAHTMSGADPVSHPEYQKMMVQTQGAGAAMLDVARSALQNRDANADLLPTMIKMGRANDEVIENVGATALQFMRAQGNAVIFNENLMNFNTRMRHYTDQGLSDDEAASRANAELADARAKQLDKEKNQAGALAVAEANIKDFGQQLVILTSNILPDLIGGLANLSTKLLGSAADTIKESQPTAQKFFDDIKKAIKSGNFTEIEKQVNNLKTKIGEIATRAMVGFPGVSSSAGGITSPATGSAAGATTTTGAPATPNEPPSIFESMARTAAREVWTLTRDEMVRGANSTMGAVKDSFTTGVNGLFDSVRDRIGLPLPGRAAGGATTPGSYLVGEEGPEIVNLGTRGDVINNDNLTEMVSSMSNQNGMKESIDQLNTTNGQMLTAIRELVQVSQRTLTATRGLNGNLFAA
jgi:hypothetical protein